MGSGAQPPGQRSDRPPGGGRRPGHEMTAPTAARVAAPPAAVLWDMDGTLVDTEPYWMECEHELVDVVRRPVDGRGRPLDHRLRPARRGRRPARAAAASTSSRGEIVERMLDGVIARVRAPRAVATGRPSAAVRAQRPGRAVRARDHVVAAAGRRGRRGARQPITFQAIVTGDGVEHGKPHPEPYLRAAAALGVDPEQCVAIEDSPDRRALGDRRRVRRRRRPQHRRRSPAAPGRDRRRPASRTSDVGDLGEYIAATPPPAAPTAPRAGVRPTDAATGPARGRSYIGGGLARRRRARGIGARRLRRWRRPGHPRERPGALERPRVDAVLGPRRRRCPRSSAHADTLHELSPFWYRTTGADTIEVEPNTPTEPGPAVPRRRPRARRAARRVDPRRHRRRRDGRHPRRPGRSAADHVDAIADVRRRQRLRRHRHRLRAVRLRRRPRHAGRRPGRTGCRSSRSWRRACTPTAAR